MNASDDDDDDWVATGVVLLSSSLFFLGGQRVGGEDVIQRLVGEPEILWLLDWFQLFLLLWFGRLLGLAKPAIYL
jgi:hypothetical protein